MDPQRAFDLIAAAGLFTIPLTSQGRVHLHQLSNEDIAEIKSSKRLNDGNRIAKKYVALKEALDALEKAMEGYPDPNATARAAQPYSLVPKGNQARTRADKSLAMVPYVQPAPLERAAWAAKLEYGPVPATCRIISRFKKFPNCQTLLPFLLFGVLAA